MLILCGQLRVRRGQGNEGEYEVSLPAVFKSLTGPPSTTLPSGLTRIRSEALRSGHATPKGLTQK
jgi:hypothetical protein